MICKRKHLTIIILISLLYFSCSKQDHKKIKLKGEIVSINETLFKPTQIASIDSFLIIADQNSEGDRLLKIINQKSNSISNFGVRGEGPGELLNIWEFDYNNSNRCIYVYDLIKFQLSFFPLDSILNNNRYLPNQISFKNFADKTPAYLRVIDSNTFIGTGVFKEGIITCYSTKDSLCKSYGKTPILSGDFTNEILTQVLSYKIAYNKQNKRTALFSENSDHFLLYDSTFHVLKDIRTQGGIDPIFTIDTEKEYSYVKFSRKTTMCYTCVFSNPKHIYCLFSGKNDLDLNNPAYLVNEIQMFDWDGNLVENFILDRMIFGGAGAISYDGKNLYGISYQTENPQILKYSL